MRASSILPALLIAGLLGAPRAEAKLPPCPGGRYLVSGASLTGAPDATAPDVVAIDGRNVAVLSGCGPAKGRVRVVGQGTKLRVRWRSCAGLRGAVTLTGTIMEQCRTLTATFTARASCIARPFLASLSRCGDGIWDPDAGEACDAGLGPCGALCTACTCADVTTTTTADTTTTSTTGGAQTTTTTPGSSTSTTGAPGTSTTSSTGAPGSTLTTTTAAPPTTTTTSPGGTSTSTMPSLTTTSTTTTTTLAGPDLVPTSFYPASSIVVGGGSAVFTWSVKNQGNATATATFYDYVLFSTDQAVGNDTAMLVQPHGTNVAGGGGQYSVQNQTVTVPKVVAGTYYAFLHTDGSNAVAESVESNNMTGFVQLTVTVPELAVTSFTGPSSAAAGSGISVSYTVKNQGNAIASPTWSDRVVLSSDAVFGNGDDVTLGTWVRGVGVTVNGTYTASPSVTLPMVAPGSYRLFFKTDVNDDLWEGGTEANNVSAPVMITIN